MRARVVVIGLHDSTPYLQIAVYCGLCGEKVTESQYDIRQKPTVTDIDFAATADGNQFLDHAAQHGIPREKLEPPLLTFAHFAD